MANNDGNGKKNQNGAQVTTSEPQVQQPVNRRADVQDRHGNDQVAAVIQNQNNGQETEASLLATMVDEQPEHQAAQEQAWWQEDDVAQQQSAEEEEEQIVARRASDTDDQKAQQSTKQAARIETAAAEKALMARAVLEGRDPAQLDMQRESRRTLSTQESTALDTIQKLEAAGKGSEQAAILALADAKNLDEADKAELLLDSGVDIDANDVENESPELQALIAATKLPGNLGDYDRDAAQLIGTTPLTERQTLQNVTNEIRMIAEQMHNHPAMLDPNASIESKSTALIETLAYAMDVPTRESLAVHPFTVLTEELIFEPQAMMEINKIAGSRRDIRQMGSFAVILWQIATDTARMELDALGDDQMVNEQDFLTSMLTGMANKMYVDALSRPGW